MDRRPVSWAAADKAAVALEAGATAGRHDQCVVSPGFGGAVSFPLAARPDISEKAASERKRQADRASRAAKDHDKSARLLPKEDASKKILWVVISCAESSPRRPSPLDPQPQGYEATIDQRALAAQADINRTPGRLRWNQVADITRNARPSSSESAKGRRTIVSVRYVEFSRETIEEPPRRSQARSLGSTSSTVAPCVYALTQIGQRIGKRWDG